jgi:hypothetical protein
MKQKTLLSIASVISLSAAIWAYGAQATTINLGDGHNPAISSDGQGHLFVVFEGVDNNSGSADIFYSSSNDGGRTWTKRLDVSPTAGVSTRPRVAIEKGGAIDVVWTDTASGENSPDIFFTRSTDGGHTWNKPIDISNTPGISSDPVVAVGQDNTIHVVFTDDGRGDRNRDVFYTSSTDGGKTWSKDRSLENVSNTPGDSSSPAIAVGADGIVHIAWKDDSAVDQIPQIYYSQRTQNAWSNAVNVSKSRRYSYHPIIACGATGRIYITWSARSKREGAADIWCIGSANNGPFTHPAHVTDSGSISSAAAMAADRADRVAVVWPNRALGLSNPKICLRMLSNDLSGYYGDMKFSKSSAVQMAPDVAIDGNKLTVVWEERTDFTTPIKVRSIDLRNTPTRIAKNDDNKQGKGR